MVKNGSPLNLCQLTYGLTDISLQHCAFAVLWNLTMYKNIIVLRGQARRESWEAET